MHAIGDTLFEIALGSGCFVHLDIATLAMLANFLPRANGTWSQQLPLPNAPSLVGVNLILWPFVGPTAHTFGGDLGAPVLLALGY